MNLEDSNEFSVSAKRFSVDFIWYVKGFAAVVFAWWLKILPDAVAKVGTVMGETQDRASQKAAAIARRPAGAVYAEGNYPGKTIERRLRPGAFYI
jgi:hypothetical protein